ncbi:uncharacterized protein DMENIID0001_130790 [Sergentomyia squamirostris]
MLTAKKKAILYEFVVDLLVKGIIGCQYPDNFMKKNLIKKVFGSYLTKHGNLELFSPIHLTSILLEIRIITKLVNPEKDDNTVYHFSTERLQHVIKNFTKVGKFYSLKGLINPEPCDLFVHHSVTFDCSTRFCLNKFNQCVICEVSYRNLREYENHMRFHAGPVIPKNAKMLRQAFQLIVIEVTMKHAVFEIINVLDTLEIIESIQLISPSYQNLMVTKDSTILMDPGKRVVLQIPRETFYDMYQVIGDWKMVFKFSRGRITRGTEVHDVVTYEKNEYVKKMIVERKIEGQKELKFYKTLQHHPTFEMEALYKNKFVLQKGCNSIERKLLEKLESYQNADKNERLHSSNYVEVMSHSLQIEELSVAKEVEKFDRSNQRLSLRKRGLYSLAIEGVSEMRPSILPNDRVFLVVQRLYSTAMSPYDAEEKGIFGRITKIEKDYVLIAIRRALNLNETFHVSFLPNRNNFRLEAHALHLLKNSPKLQSILFPEVAPTPRSRPSRLEPIWFNRCVAANAEQKSAVLHIVAGTAYPCPYIIFGPPGTGKTMTLVESVCQLWKQQPNSSILITAQSNAACDEIAIRLLKYLPSCDIMRIYSKVKERDLMTMDPDLLRVANTKGDFRIYYPPLKTIYQLRIVICTISMAGKFVQARINTNHFTHVFIDESGCCTESQTIVPIVGIVANEHHIHGQVILAGDHKQLGPVLTSSLAKERDYGVSMMERLINSPAYKKDKQSRKYNPNLVTKLLHNYRSYPAILDVCNSMFYDNELIPEAKNDWALKWKFLPNRRIPIVFDPIGGSCDQDIDSPSYFNVAEIEAVMTIVGEILRNGIRSRKIEEKDVGIIAPYRKQVTKIKNMCIDRKWENIEVASVELFQGKEKEIIIMSTVRSNRRSLGFLSDPKRLNVALTRAKSLLIIVGNPITLMNDKNWRFVIDLYAKYGLIAPLSKKICFANNFDTSLNAVTHLFENLHL